MVRRLSWLALVLAITVAGCSRAPKRPPGPGSADTDENQAMLGKLAGYIECLNDHAARTFQIADSYATRLGGKPPTVDSRVLLQVAPDPTRCLRAIDAAQKLPPALPELEADAARFAAAIKAVFELTTRGHAYFDRDNHATYDPAKGVALHPEIVAAFAAFDAAQGALFDAVSQLNHKVHVDQQARLEKRDGRVVISIAERMMIEAEDLVRYAATPWNRVDKLDADALFAQLDLYENLIEELASSSLAHPEDADRIGGRIPALLDLARGYLVVGRQLAQRAKDHAAFTEAEQAMIAAGNEAAVTGAPAAMARAYNRLVEDYNQRLL
jgi:hypothetical protein